MPLALARLPNGRRKVKIDSPEARFAYSWCLEGAPAHGFTAPVTPPDTCFQVHNVLCLGFSNATVCLYITATRLQQILIECPHTMALANMFRRRELLYQIFILASYNVFTTDSNAACRKGISLDASVIPRLHPQPLPCPVASPAERLHATSAIPSRIVSRRVVDEHTALRTG